LYMASEITRWAWAVLSCNDVSLLDKGTEVKAESEAEIFAGRFLISYALIS
jgi:hypothetical protein